MGVAKFVTLKVNNKRLGAFRLTNIEIKEKEIRKGGVSIRLYDVMCYLNNEVIFGSSDCTSATFNKLVLSLTK